MSDDDSSLNGDASDEDFDGAAKPESDDDDGEMDDLDSSDDEEEMPKKKSKEDAAAPAAAPKLAKPSKAPKEPKAPKAPKEPKAKAPKADNAAGAKAKAAAGAGAGAGAASSSTGVVAPSAAPRPAGAGAGSSKAAAGPKKIATQGDADEVVLNYLTKLGKPVTLTLLDQNLHGALPKQLLQKSLDNLVEAGHLAKKDFKSSVLYWLDQAQFSDVTPDMVTELMQSIEQLTSAKNETTNTRRGLEQRYSSLSTAMTEAEMDAKIAELEAEMETKNARLAKITGGVAGAGAGSSSSSSSAAAALDPLRKAKAKTILERYRRVWSDRKGAVMDMVEHMAEGLNKKTADLLATMGVETDKDAGVDIKDFFVK